MATIDLTVTPAINQVTIVAKPSEVKLVPTGAGGGTTTDLVNHINSPAPHPAYDDMPSLVLLFENGLI